MKHSVMELCIGLLVLALAGCASGPPNLPAPDSGHGVMLDAPRVEVTAANGGLSTEARRLRRTPATTP